MDNTQKNRTEKDQVLENILNNTFFKSNEGLQRRLIALQNSGSETLRKSLDTRMKYAFCIDELRKSKDPFHPSPSDELSTDADILLSAEIPATQCQLGIKFDDLNGNTLIMGASNAGKSNTAKCIIDLLMQSKKYTVWIITREKPYDEYSFMAGYNEPVLFIEGNQWKVNPFEPVGPSVEWSLLASRLQAFEHSFFQGTEGRASNIINSLYERFDTDRTGRVPAIIDVIRENEEQTAPRFDPEFNYRTMYNARLQSLFKAPGGIFNCRKGYPIEKLATQHMVLDLHRYGRHADFIILELILRLKTYRDINKLQPDGRQNIIILEDAFRVFPRQPEKSYNSPDKGIPISSEIIMTIRSRDIHLIVLLQDRDLAATALINNTALKFMGMMNEGKNLREMAMSMGCTKEEHFLACHKLQQGQFLVKTPRYPTPFVVQFPKFPEPTGIDLEAKIKTMREQILSSLPYEPISEEQIKELEPEALQKKSNHFTISADGLALLKAVATNPDIHGVVILYKKSGFGSRGKGDKAKKELDSKGLIRLIRKHQKGIGRNPLCLVVTQEGWRVLESFNIKKPNMPGMGSSLHKSSQQTIKNYYRKKYPQSDVRIEGFLKGFFIDVLVEMPDGSRIGIEVALSKKHQATNIINDLCAGCSEVILACPTKELRELLKKEILAHLQQSDRTRVSFMLISDFED